MIARFDEPRDGLDGFGRQRNFLSSPRITEADFAGPRALLDNRYKLVVGARSGKESVKELFDLRADPAESKNLFEAEPETAAKLERRLRAWQESVLESLTGADYGKRRERGGKR